MTCLARELFLNSVARTIRTLVTHAALVGVLAGIGMAQDPAAGSPPFVTSVKGQLDTLSLPSGNVFIEFPIRTKSGKYPFNYSLYGNSHAFIDPPPNGNYVGEWNVNSLRFGLGSRASGSQFADNLGTITRNSYSFMPCNGVTQNYVYYNWGVLESNGTQHPFPASMEVDAGGCFGTSAFGTTTDGSGYTLQLTIVNPGPQGTLQTTLWDKAGNVIHPYPAPPSCNGDNNCIIDQDGVAADGGFFNSSPLVDTTGQPLVTPNRTGASAGDTYTYNDIKGNPQSVKVNYTQIPTVTNFGPSVARDIGPYNNWTPTSVVYPDGETIMIGYETTALPQWQALHAYAYPNAVVDTNGNLEGPTTFGTSGSSQPAWNTVVGGKTTDGSVVWNNYGSTWTTSRVASITYPQGGSVSYTYSGMYGFIAAGTYASMAWPSQITRSVKDNNGNTNTWTYQISNPSSNHSTVTVTETDPASNVTVTYYVGATTTDSASCQTAYSQYCVYSYIESEKLSYRGPVAASNLIGEQVTCYNGKNSSETGCVTPSTPILFPISQTDVYIHPIGSSGSAGTPSDAQTVYDAYGNVTSKKYYNFGATFPPSGSPLSATTTVYNTGSSCGTLANVAMRDRPCSVTVSGPSGQVSQVKYTYNSGGHPTQTSAWVSGTTYLTSTASYNTNGTIASFKDANQSSTNYYYNGTGGCNNVLLTSTALPVNSLSTAQTWDCNGGVLTSVTDANGQTTQYGYVDQNGVADPNWRMLSTTDPIGNTTWNTHTTSTTPFSQESALLFNSNNSAVDAFTTFDGIGRPIVQQTRQAPASASLDSVQYTYGQTPNVGPFTTASVPYVGTQGQSAPSGTKVTTTQQDALGRTLSVTDGGGGYTTYGYTLQDVLVTRGPAPMGENTKQRQLEYDALGKLRSVCEITSASGSGNGACGQANPATGFLTKYTYDALGNLLTVTQNAQPGAKGGQQSRNFFYDGLGRLTQESNPETGTIKYIYDTDGICGTSSGDLVKKVDAANNVTCYAYDGMHRVTGITYPSGPYAAATPSKTFLYDATTFSCTNQNGAFVKGRLAEAFTGPSTAKITDIAYCYSPRGETADVFESTPHSGSTPYHTVASYWANGALNTLSGVPKLSGWIFSPDGEGRPYSATYGASTNWVTGTTYFPSNPQTTVTFGNGDSDVYAYDANTGRMRQFQFIVGTAPKLLTGVLGWNANSTLGTLGITDQFNSTNTQNCTYVYDDLARIQNVNCMHNSTTVWNQAFAIDAFGNLSKSGSTTFSATYLLPNGTTNNQEQTVSSCVPAYDANGNLTSDCSFVPSSTYAWDADGNPTNLNGVSLTYDAFDHEVEIASGSTYTEVLYGPIGRLGLMNGQNAQTIRVPLPGRSTAELIGSTGGIQHTLHTDWLGSSRLSTIYGSRGLAYEAEYAPFGENYGGHGTSSYDLDFTGQFQDTLGGLYDFLYRKYSPVQGRWIMPDPSGLGAADPTDPQSWNRYAYVLNDPMSNVDPDGLECVWDNGRYDDPQDPDSGTPAKCDGLGGTWINPLFFATLGLPDWSNDPNPDLASLVDIIQNGPSDVTVTAVAPKSYADCVRTSGDYFSFQNMLAGASGDRLGHDRVSQTLLSNPVSDVIGGMQDTSELLKAVVHKGTEVGLKQAGNYLMSVSRKAHAKSYVYRGPASDMYKLQGWKGTHNTIRYPYSGQGSVLKGAGEALETMNFWNYGVSSVSAMICGIGR
jgi:RHS repeat-associated protein